MFFALIRVWLWILAARRYSSRQPSPGATLDGLDVGVDLAANLPTPNWHKAASGGGGSFSGGGASGSYGTSDSTDLKLELPDSDEGTLLLLFGALIVAILGSAGYLIYIGPDLLAEAAFDVILASSLLRSARRMDSEHWAGSVLRKTGWIFAIVFVLALGLGTYVQSKCPSARTVKEAIRSCGEP